MRSGREPAATAPARSASAAEEPRSPIARNGRAAALACTALLAGVTLGACGGGNVSVAVPKSTPDLVPPTDTTAEATAVQTTSTSTTSTSTTSTNAEGSSGGGESSGGESSESSSGSSGGTSAEKHEEAHKEEPSKGGSEAGGSSPTGGASAP